MPMAEDWAVYNQSKATSCLPDSNCYRVDTGTEIPEVKKCWHESSAKGHWVSGPAKVEISLTIVASN